MRRSKITVDQKIKAVRQYLSGKQGAIKISRDLGIDGRTLYRWVRIYKTFGMEGLKDKPHNRHYSAEMKRQAVEEYLRGGISQAQICSKYKILSARQLRNWIKVYNGHREFKAHSCRGSEIYMTKGRRTTFEERIEIVSYCIEHGTDYAAAAEKYGVSYQQIYSWVQKYNKKGTDGLIDKRGKRKPEAEMTEMEKLRAEMRLLKAKNKRLEVENAVLKKLEELERGWH